MKINLPQVFLIIISILLIYLFFTKNRNVYREKRNYSINNNAKMVKVKNKLDSLKFKKIELNDFCIIKIAEEESLNTNCYKILGIFSNHGCGTCLSNEIAEWEFIFRENKSIKLYAICSDTIKSDVYRFISSYSPSFSVYRTLNSKFSFSQITPCVLLLNENNIVENTYYSEVGNDRKRQKFYQSIENHKFNN